MTAFIDRSERNAFVARMKNLCAAGGMRCPDGRRMFRLPDNPLLKADRLALIDVPEGGCALTGAFGKEGFFAAPCAASAEGAGALMRAVAERQRAWGVDRVTGPVKPSVADPDNGAALAERDVSPFTERLPMFFCEALRKAGFEENGRSILYELKPEAVDWAAYSRAAAYSQARFGYRVLSARSMGDRAACLAMARVSRTDPAMAHTDEETEALLSALGGRWSRRMTQIALRGEEPLGYLLALADRRAGTARAATIQVRPDFRNRALTAALALPMLREARGLRVECGVIDENNLASRLSVEHAGGKPAALIRRYSLDFIQI